MSAIDAGPAWQAWTQVTPVLAARSHAARYVRVALPLAIDPGAGGDYPDLRVVDEHGREYPYALDPLRPHVDERGVPLIDVGFVPRRGTQGVVDLGTSGALVDAVVLDVDADRRPTYFERVALDASDDRHTWRVVRDDAIAYRVAQDGGHGSTTLTFPPTRSRWLRVRVLDPSAAFPLTGARVESAAPPEPSLAQVAIARAEHDDAAAHVQTWTFSAAVPVRAIAVSFADGGALYQRAVSIETSNDTKDWSAAGDGVIAHFAEGGAHTTVCFTESTAHYVRVTVHNGNDAPLRSLHPALLARPHAIVFASGGTRRLVSGNPKADAPTYDLAARLAVEPWNAAGAATGMTVANAGFRDARPIGERFPWLVTGALLASAFALGLVALRSMPPSDA
jgi:hypothetical protein